MMKNRILMLIFASAITLTSHITTATSITVKKVKGNQAVIEMTSPLEQGQTYNIETESLTLQTNYSQQFKSRFNSISFGANLNLISGTKVLENTFAFYGKYGWNHTQFEFGPLINLEIFDKGFGTSTTYLIGGYYDYNVTPNKSGHNIIYGPTAQFSLGNRNYDAGGSAQITQFQLSGFMTYFINNSPLAIKTEIGYLYRKVIASAAENILTGVNSQVYFSYYY